MIKPCYFIPLLLVAIAGFLPSATSFATPPEKGSFLVADENLADPRFRDRTILLIQHDAKGSAGLVVDRSSRLPLASVMGKGSKLSAQNALLSYGGPVEPQTLLTLVKVRNHPPEPSDVVLPSLYVTGAYVLDEWPDFSAEVVDYRVFAGYAGWAPGQLNEEIGRGDWSVAPYDEEVIFETGHDSGENPTLGGEQKD